MGRDTNLDGSLMLCALSKTIGVGSLSGACELASHGFTARFLSACFHSMEEDAVQAVGGTA